MAKSRGAEQQHQPHKNKPRRKNFVQLLQAIAQSNNRTLLFNDIYNYRKHKKGYVAPPHPEYMRMVSFAGIPAMVLNGRGIGRSRQEGDESAAQGFLGFLRSVFPKKTIDALYLLKDDDPEAKEIQEIRPFFASVEKLIQENFGLVQTLSQYEATHSAKSLGSRIRNLAKHDMLSQQNNNFSSKNKKNKKDEKKTDNESRQEDEVILIDKDNTQTVKSSKKSEDVIILDDDEPSTSSIQNRPSREATPSEVIEMRNVDLQTKIKVENEINIMRSQSVSAQINTANITPGYTPPLKNKENGEIFVNFGEVWSDRGPAQVTTGRRKKSIKYVADTSSEDDDGDPDYVPPLTKRKRFNEKDSAQVEVLKMNVTSNEINEKTEEKVSFENEIQVVDEWDEEQEKQEKSVEKSNELQSRIGCSAEKIYDGESSLQQLVKKRNWSKNYEKNVIGVITNKKAASVIEGLIWHVSVSAKESLEKMSAEIWEHFTENAQNFEIYEQKMKVRSMLITEIQKIFPDKHLSMHVTGSSVNGCGSFNSDIDMCLCYPIKSYKGNTFEDYNCDRGQAGRILKKIDRLFKYGNPKSYARQIVKTSNFIPATVPIIKVVMNPPYENLDIDINVNNIAGIYNSHLLHYYSQVDGRFPAIALLVKHWAIRNKINDSMNGTLNSYSLILLVVHFLQCGVTPAVLPNLQYIFPEKFDVRLPLEKLQLFGNLVEKLPVLPPNTWTIGELLIGFFHYYARFDFQKNAISIRSAQVFPRNILEASTAKFQIFIEEPFDAINTARCVRDSSQMAKICNAFQKAAEVFSKEKFDLAEIKVFI